MTRVSVVGTRHEAHGALTVTALVTLLAYIKPEVIFLESPPAVFDDYLSGVHRSLESAAATRYREMNDTDLVPVDLPTPDAAFFASAQHLFGEVERASPDYCRLIDWHRQYIGAYGLAYLNSEHCLELQAKLDQAIAAAIDHLADPQLAEFHRLWISTNRDRESAMMQAIESHCSHTSVDIAAFLVGAAHRPSMIDRARALAEAGSSRILWDFSDFLHGST
jgi:hypothetical protein